MAVKIKHSLLLMRAGKCLYTWSAKAHREGFSLVGALCRGLTGTIQGNVPGGVQ